jgi:hypothetical protein
MRVIRSAGQNVSPSDDGRLFDQIFTDGLFEETTITHLGANNVALGAMYGIICGRDFTAEAQTVAVELPEDDAGTTGYIYVEIDTSSDDVITIGSALAPFTPTYEDLNTNGAVAQMIIAEYVASSVAITSLTPVYVMATSGSVLPGSVATVEVSPAVANHAVGDFILYGGQLYSVTAAISVGESLTPGTNISATSAGSELTSLKSGLNYEFISNPTSATVLCKSGNTVKFYTTGVQPTANFLNTVVLTDSRYRPRVGIFGVGVVSKSGVYQTALASLKTDGTIVFMDSGGNTIRDTSTYIYCIFDFTYFI